MARGLQAGINATCAHPESLKGKSIFEVPSGSFVCGELYVCVFAYCLVACDEREAFEARMTPRQLIALLLFTHLHVFVQCFGLSYLSLSHPSAQHVNTY